MQLLGISSLLFLTFQGPVQALQASIACTTTADCASGETCVAGDSDTAAQACVPSTVCGGSSMGNCPSDDSGKLVCLWRPYNDCSEGCAVLEGSKGIYKCVSLSRCDAYFGGTSCSGGCSVNGVRCNGQGSCNMMSLSPGKTPDFSCACENGYSGNKCEVAPGSTEASPANSSSTGKVHSAGIILDDDSGTDPKKKDATADGSPKDGSPDTSEYRLTETPKKPSSNTPDDPKLSSDEPNSDASRSTTSGPPKAANSGSVSKQQKHYYVRIILVIAVIIMLGTALLVVYILRRRKQQHEAEEYANALASAQGVGEVGLRDLAAGHTGETPRAHVILV